MLSGWVIHSSRQTLRARSRTEKRRRGKENAVRQTDGWSSSLGFSADSPQTVWVSVDTKGPPLFALCPLFLSFLKIERKGKTDWKGQASLSKIRQWLRAIDEYEVKMFRLSLLHLFQGVGYEQYLIKEETQSEHYRDSLAVTRANARQYNWTSELSKQHFHTCCYSRLVQSIL